MTRPDRYLVLNGLKYDAEWQTILVPVPAKPIIIFSSFSNQEYNILKNLLPLLLILTSSLQSGAQALDCNFKDPVFTIDFGKGAIEDLNTSNLYNYRRVTRYCPSDGYYSYSSFTSDCFSNDWLSIMEDHTPGDANGNMMIVNASPSSGTFLTTAVDGLKGGTTYEFSVWMMNVCKPTEKCPYPLLPNITIMLQRADGKMVADFSTGELIRRNEPLWTKYQVIFTTTPSETKLTLTMIDNAPGGCGNDFVLDDIAIRECVIIKPEVTIAKTKNTPVVKKPVITSKPAPKKEAPPVVKKDPVVPPPVVKPPVVVTAKPVTPPVAQNTKPVIPEKVPEKKPVPSPVVKTAKPAQPPVVTKQPPRQSPPIAKVEKEQGPQVTEPPKPAITVKPDTVVAVKPKPVAIPPPPSIVATRANPLIKEIQAEPGEIKVSLYDNGEIDGDTISVYHNNILMISHARLTEKAITFNITIDAEHPHHELVMVAHNLGSIPPNTSLMVVTAGTKRYEVFISSNDQKNGKVVIDLKE